jgi:hypothetical protein
MLNGHKNISEQFNLFSSYSWDMVAKISWNFNEFATISDSDRHIAHLRKEIEEMLCIHMFENLIVRKKKALSPKRKG